MTTLERLLEAVFSGERTDSPLLDIPDETICELIERLPYTLSQSQKTAVSRAINNEITYIQGPPGTGKSFTIAATSLLASQLGMRVLIASQRPTAVKVVYDKITSVMGDSASLYISDLSEVKQKARQVIADLLEVKSNSQVQRDQNDLQELQSEIDTLIETKHELSCRLFNAESDLKAFYEHNERSVKRRDEIVDDFALTRKDLLHILPLVDETSRIELSHLLEECSCLRQKSVSANGSLHFADAARLKILTSVILNKLNVPKKLYDLYKEDFLARVVEYSSLLAKSFIIGKRIVAQSIDTIRSSFANVSKRLYSESPSNSKLAELLRCKLSVRQSSLLKEKKYRSSLEFFRKDFTGVIREW